MHKEQECKKKFKNFFSVKIDQLCNIIETKESQLRNLEEKITAVTERDEYEYDFSINKKFNILKEKYEKLKQRKPCNEETLYTKIKFFKDKLR